MQVEISVLGGRPSLRATRRSLSATHEMQRGPCGAQQLGPSQLTQRRWRRVSPRDFEGGRAPSARRLRHRGRPGDLEGRAIAAPEGSARISWRSAHRRTARPGPPRSLRARQPMRPSCTWQRCGDECEQIVRSAWGRRASRAGRVETATAFAGHPPERAQPTTHPPARGGRPTIVVCVHMYSLLHPDAYQPPAPNAPTAARWA